jgi:hypothetical protein
MLFVVAFITSPCAHPLCQPSPLPAKTTARKHTGGEEKKQLLIRKAYDALPPGGAFIAVRALFFVVLLQSDASFFFSARICARATFVCIRMWIRP